MDLKTNDGSGSSAMSLAERIQSLDERKKDAVKDENFQQAQILKEEIEALRAEANAKSHGDGDVAASSKEQDMKDAEGGIATGARETLRYFNEVCAASTIFEVTKDYKETKSHLNPARHNNFLKDIKFSPDGLCLLSVSNDRHLRLYESPPSYDSSSYLTPSAPPDAVLDMRELGTVYDTAWYPCMRSSDPSTCVFLSASQKNPTRLWDAFSGQVRATYRSYDYADELTAPISVAFNGNGTKIICGFDRHIRIFDLGRPGRDYEMRVLVKSLRARSAKTKRRRVGQRGLISSIDSTTYYGGLYACGSYAGSTYVYEENSGKVVCNLAAHSNGVTKVKFAPDAVRLWTGGRRDNILLEWDLRMLKIIKRYERLCQSNQKYSFDVSPGGKFLITGSQRGDIFIFDTTSNTHPLVNPHPGHDGIEVKMSKLNEGHSKPKEEAESFNKKSYGLSKTNLGSKEDSLELQIPQLTLQGPGDAVNSVSFHPSFSEQYPSFAACTGERKYWLEAFSEPESDDQGEDSNVAFGHNKQPLKKPRTHNSIVLYGVSGTTTLTS